MPQASNVKPCFLGLENDIGARHRLNLRIAGVVLITTLGMGKLSQLRILEHGLRIHRLKRFFDSGKNILRRAVIIHDKEQVRMPKELLVLV